MKAHFIPTNPDNIEYTLELTLPLEKWRELRDQIEQIEMHQYTPAGQLSHAILDVVFQARKHWYPEETE